MTRTFKLHYPLDDDQLLFVKMSGTEEMSAVSTFELDCVSPSDSIDPLELLGQSLTVEVTTQYEGCPRYINSVVTHFRYVGPDSSAKQLYKYKAKLSSWLYLADKVSDCRVFMDKSVPDIVKIVLGDLGMPFEMKLMDSYEPREFVMMYNETVLHLVRRLTEEVGIYFYTKHENGSHTVVFTDGGHMTLPQYAKIPFLTPKQRTMDIEEQVKEWDLEHELHSGRYVTSSYNFKTPNAKLQKIDDQAKGHNHDELEIYEWHGRYPDLGEGGQLARVRREQQQLGFQKIDAKSNVRGIMPGYYFKLTDHPVASNNAEYLIIGATYYFQENTQTDDGKETEWHVDFTAKPSNERYQPPRVSNKIPVVGPHTAKVTGPAGQEIWTDSYGRIKVQFAWDRYGKNDENSSCWIRVASPWAGSNFGAVHIPRIGQEVMVEYVGGDGDQPLVTGSVYNQSQMPPWELPANATQSGVLSRSSQGGAYGNANAIRFEDKKGAEQVWIQAERNMDTVVEYDETHHVMHDRTKTIDHDETVFVHHDRTETVDNDETITVHNNRKERVDQNETISIGANRAEEVGQNETVMIVGNRTNAIGGNHTETIGQNLTETVTMANVQNVGLAKMTNVGAGYSINVGAAMNTIVAGFKAEEVGLHKTTVVVGDNKTKVGASMTTNVEKDFVLQAGSSITLKTGDSMIVMKSNGDITIQAGGTIFLKASKVTEN